MRAIYTLLLVLILCSCGSKNPYLDPAKNEVHATLSAINQRGFLKSDVIIEKINGFDLNHAGRWSSLEARLRPGLNNITLKIIGNGNLMGWFSFEFDVKSGESYKIYRADVEDGFWVQIKDSRNSIAYQGFAKAEVVYEKQSRPFIYIPPVIKQN